MSKKLCKESNDHDKNCDHDKNDKKLKYECKKCGKKSHKEEKCCKPIKITKAA